MKTKQLVIGLLVAFLLLICFTFSRGSKPLPPIAHVQQFDSANAKPIALHATRIPSDFRCQQVTIGATSWYHVYPHAPEWWAVKCLENTPDNILYPVHWMAMCDFVTPATCDGRYWIDVGTNMGAFAHYAAAAGCRVIGVEPQRKLALANTLTMLANGKQQEMTIINAVVSNDLDAGYSMSAAPGGNMGGSSAHQDSGADAIRAVTVDQLLAPLNPGDVVVLKIDVEGFEEIAVRSGKAQIARVRPDQIWIEWNPADYKDPFGLMDLLVTELGYHLYLLPFGEVCVDGPLSKSGFNHYDKIELSDFKQVVNRRADYVLTSKPLQDQQGHVCESPSYQSDLSSPPFFCG